MTRRIFLAGGAAAFAAAVTGGLALRNLGRAACKNGEKFKALEMSKANGCLEFWVNRYQTTIQTVLSSAIGGVGLYFIIHQLRGLRDQNDITRQTLENAQRESEKNWRIAKEQAASALHAFSGAIGEARFIVFKHFGAAKKEPEFPTPAMVEASRSGPLVAAALDTEHLRAEWGRMRREFVRLIAYAGAGGEPDAIAAIRTIEVWKDVPANSEEWARRADRLTAEIDRFATSLIAT